jgi:hypothetical protein
MYCCWKKMEAKGAGTCDWENQEAGAIFIYIYIYIYCALSTLPYGFVIKFL